VTFPLFDDPQNLSTKAVLDWYDLLTSGLAHEQTNARAILRSGSSPPSYLRDTLIGATPDDVDEYFESCQLELDLCADLLLIAWAEARVRTDAEKRRLHSDVLGKRLSLLYQNKETLWGVPLYEGGILEAWKQHINNSAQIPSSDKSRMLSRIGAFKNALILRHWVAHGRSWNLTRALSDFEAVTLARTVEDLYATLQAVTTYDSLLGFY
jgi:hypothetical protein